MERKDTTSTIIRSEHNIKTAVEQMRKELFEYGFICRTIKKLQAEVQDLGNLVKAERDTSKAIVYWGSETQKSNKIVDPTADAVSNIIDKYEAQVVYVNQKLHDLYMKKNRVEENIDMLDDLERKLIELRYFKKLRWFEVARGVEYSERHCRRMDNAILNKLVQI